jgi:16S rRNA processing protein RimM
LGNGLKVAPGPDSPRPENLVCVGRIAGGHGIRGWVRITSYTEIPENVGAYGPVTDETGEHMFELEVMRMAKAHVLARIPGVEDRNAADALRGVRLFVPRDRLPAPDDDEFYYDDLVGILAETSDGEALGEILSVQEFGSGPMLEIGRKRGRTFLVPFTRDMVPIVDLAAGRIVVEPVPGLLDPAGKPEEEADHGAR